jgi:dihydrofolate reductase
VRANSRPTRPQEVEGGCHAIGPLRRRGGGELFRSLLAAELVDSIEVSVIPILLGSGIPLLPPPASRARLKLREHKLYPKTGIVGLAYDITRSSKS